MIAWTNVGGSGEKRIAYDPTADSKFPAGMRVVSFRRPTWNDDGKSVQVGFANWDDKIVPQRGGAGRMCHVTGKPLPAPTDKKLTKMCECS